MQSNVGIALLGRGTVGGGVADLLTHRKPLVERRSGASYTVRGIANRSTDPIALIDDPHVDLVVECIGGTTIAVDCIEHSLERRKHVVTANKDAIATQGPRLRALAAAKGVTLRYEAAVASAIPILGALDGALCADETTEIGGILNGTCNFMLTAMRHGSSFAHALAEARAAGYAEADPSADIEGLDTAHKLAILMQHAFDAPIVTQRIRTRGISGIKSTQVRQARQHGYELKLIAYARREAAQIQAEVGPMLVPISHPFARISGVDNAVRVVRSSSGPLLFTGAGAGREPSAAAVAGDIIATLRTIAERHIIPQPRPHARPIPNVVAAFERFPVFAGYPLWTIGSPSPAFRQPAG